MKLVTGDWNRDFRDEASLAPRGAHDHQLDAVSGPFSTVALETMASLEPGAQVPLHF